MFLVLISSSCSIQWYFQNTYLEVIPTKLKKPEDGGLIIRSDEIVQNTFFHKKLQLTPIYATYLKRQAKRCLTPKELEMLHTYVYTKAQHCRTCTRQM